MQKRLISLDVFRGLTIALMIIVNNPGSWSFIYPPFRHADWHGWTPTDMVFPFFLFIVGVAISLSFSKLMETGSGKSDLVRKIIRRTLIIFGLGLFLNGWSFGIPMNSQSAANFEWMNILRSFETIRIPGVLQRIALCYFAAAMISLYLPTLNKRIYAAAGIFILYELLMRNSFIEGWGNSSFELEDNFARLIDMNIITPAHMYKVNKLPFDPEGLISTLPAIITTLLGVFTGNILSKQSELTQKLKNVSVTGIILIAAGYLFSMVEPINKQLWTVSYTLLMGGWAMLFLAISSWFIDLRGWAGVFKPFIFLGSNAIVAFVGSSFTAKCAYLIKFANDDGSYTTLKTLIYEKLCVPIAGEMVGSELYALIYLVLWTLIAWYMYNKKIFVKI